MSWFPGGWEWLVILVIMLLLFGSRLPKVSKALGQSIGMFRKGANEALDCDDEE